MRCRRIDASCNYEVGLKTEIEIVVVQEKFSGVRHPEIQKMRREIAAMRVLRVIDGTLARAARPS